ncbi:hypothetical protein EMCRGX_G000016 [Ephydatia muelleri]
MSVLFSEILRIKAQCTEEREFKKLKVDFTKHFLQRGYPFALIKAAVQKVEGMPGHDTVIRRNQEVMPLKIEFDKRIANIHKVLREQQHEINDSPELQFLNYNTRLLVAFRNKRNVRQLTTSSALEKDKVLNPVLGEPHNWGFSLMTKKCDNYQCMLKNSDSLQTSRYTPPSQRREELAKRKKDADEAKQKELEETRKKKRLLESAKDLTPYQKKLEEAKERAISQGKFTASCCSRREDGTIQLEGVLRGCSPFALEFEVSDDQHDDIGSTHQSVNTNPSQSSTADCVTSNLDQNPVGVRSLILNPNPSQETAKIGAVLTNNGAVLTNNVAPDSVPLIVETSIPNHSLAPVPSLLVEALVQNHSPDPAPSIGVGASVPSQNLAPVLSSVTETSVQQHSLIPVPSVIVEALAQNQNPAPVPPVVVVASTQNQNVAPVSPLVEGVANEDNRIKKTFDLHEELLILEDTILALGMLDHHVSFVEDCIHEMVYPLGLKAFVPCAVFRSNNALKREWKKVLHATSTELLALCKLHYRRTEVAIRKDLAELKLKGESLKGDDRIKWEMRECNAWRESEFRSKKMNEKRKKKLKHTKTIHMEGRIFTEHCLVERPVVEHVQVAKEKTVSSNQDVLRENDVSEVEKSPARTVTLASEENGVLVNQSHSRSANIGSVQRREESYQDTITTAER